MSDQLEQKFQKKGLKLTDQRRTIARVILESKEAYGESDHPDVDELYNRVSKIDPKISIATVYRTVKLFEEAGILTKHDYKTGHTSVDSVFISLLHHFVYWFHIWEDNGFGAIKDEWMRRAFKLGGSVSVENKNGLKAEYKFRGIDMEGAILLDDENGKRSRIRSGTVRFL